MPSKRKPADPPPTPPAPPCSNCGEPGTCEVTVEVRGLRLERDAGVHARPYWQPSYRSVETSIKTILCGACVRACVQIDCSVQATLEKAKKK